MAESGTATPTGFQPDKSASLQMLQEKAAQIKAARSGRDAESSISALVQRIKLNQSQKEAGMENVRLTKVTAFWKKYRGIIWVLIIMGVLTYFAPSFQGWWNSMWEEEVPPVQEVVAPKAPTWQETLQPETPKFETPQFKPPKRTGTANMNERKAK